MEFLRKAVKVGNSSGVILPKKLLGSEVKITVIKRSVEIKKQAVKLLEKYFEDIVGIYIISKNPVGIIAVSKKLKIIIRKQGIKISVVPISRIKKDMNNKQSLRQKIISCETILNPVFLDELKKEGKRTNPVSLKSLES
ncbi:MAG: hypothetical protein KJ559_00710 [Nanoarchaeota archaeon]|nr:hypothetical protein [Nanoarchaeota archaeon]